jgi:uncharacterized membrane protein (Fun14 family)
VVLDSILASAADSPLLTTVGFGTLVGFLIGIAVKKLFKILAVIAGAFLAMLMYLEQQEIVNINWDKLNVAFNGVLSTFTHITNSTSGVGGSHTTAAASLLPTTIMTNLGIPLTGSAALGFTIGIMKG